MRRKARKTDDLLDLAEQKPEPVAPPSAAPSTPAFLEYKPFFTTEPWRVALFELFQAEFALVQPYEKSMAIFHEMAEGYARGWLIAKMLFGVTPVIVPENADPLDMQPKPRDLICEKLGITKEQLQAELNTLRGLWQVSGLKKAEEQPVESVVKDKEALPFNDNLFHDLGFSEEIFEVKRRDPETKEEKPRSTQEKKIEREWFMKRVKDWERMLTDPMGGTLVRQTLMNELYLRRLETEISMVMPGTDLFTKLQRIKGEIEATYLKQLEDLKPMFPEMNIGGKNAFHASISDFVQGLIEYKKDGSSRLLDGIHTAAEIDVEMRQSIQRPDPQYRMGLSIYWIEAMHGILDPSWRSQLPHRMLKKMDAAGKAAINAAREDSGEQMVDLEKGVAPGEGSQFPDLNEYETQEA